MSDSNENGEIQEIKAILIGDSGVGKTNLINTSVGLEFVEGRNPTISGSFISKKIKINDTEYIVNLWDTAGQEAYKGVTKLFFKGSEIIILVYDITTQASFESLKEWSKLSEDIIENEHVYGVVGNKNDLYLNAIVNEDEVKEFAKSLKTNFKLVSAKTDPNSFVEYLTDLVCNFKKIDRNAPPKDSIKLKNQPNEKQKINCWGKFTNIFKKKEKQNK